MILPLIVSQSFHILVDGTQISWFVHLVTFHTDHLRPVIPAIYRDSQVDFKPGAVETPDGVVV
jgi:hypothetical protein